MLVGFGGNPAQQTATAGCHYIGDTVPITRRSIMFKLGQRLNPNLVLALNYNLKTLRLAPAEPKTGTAYAMPQDWKAIKSQTQPLTK